ncbi:hypothetical protein [Streptomyces sp. NBC_00083]|uniref:hypothetical protein n=1 Tax=Streptomyces sp. NBC_00083 TaxID=2975647 RepID=UPI0022547061|nr:hypothetical protein [Streptomyces sp. NBC_00083]MCX5385254.1 hypothetical protein [Streptomyces sp. NBC_00083]
MRRLIAIVAALVLFAEACAIVLVNWVLGRVAANQHMSLAGVDPKAISSGAWVAGGLFGLFLTVCGILLLIIGIRDRAPGRVARITLIACAVVHAVLGAFLVGLVGWSAFACLMVVLALLVFVLLAYAKERPAPGPEPEDAPGGAPATA